MPKKKTNSPTKVDPLAAIAHLMQTHTAMLDTQAAQGRRLDAVEDIVGSIADTDELRSNFVRRFGRSRRRAQVFLAINGIRDANAVAKIIRKTRQNVDVEVRFLIRNRLIELVGKDGSGAIYRKRVVDKWVGLSHELRDKFQLDQDGRPTK